MNGFGKNKKLESDKDEKSFSNISNENILKKAFDDHSKGNILQAEEYYKYLIEKGFNNPGIFSNYGVILKQRGDTSKAIDLYKKCIQLLPNSSEAYNNLGNIYKDIGKLDEAEENHRKAIEIKPDFAEAHNNLANTLTKLKRIDEAKLYLLKAIELKPNFYEAQNNLGSIFIDNGKLEEAEISLKKAILINPMFSQAYHNLGYIYKEKEMLLDAEDCERKAIKLNPNYAEAYNALGLIMMDQNKFLEAEILIRKAIKISPYYFEAYNNIGVLLMNIGRLEEAEISIIKGIKINPNFVKSYYVLSTMKSSVNTNKWEKQLFSSKILENKNDKDIIDIYFARSNILHREKRYNYSAEYLIKANEIKLKIFPSQANRLIKKTQSLLTESNKLESCFHKINKSPLTIFIVGMPRSGSTLIESILSMNKDLKSLGETNILEKSFIEWKEFSKINTKLKLAELYRMKTQNKNNVSKITSDKWLYNYQYTGIIANQIPNSRIIHCFRNPLDNILSLFRAHFKKGNRYSSNLIDCAKVYLNQEEVMQYYKNKYRSIIYDLNYNLLVTNPQKEISKLIKWLEWDFNETYLSPHLSNRAVLTASNIQVRSPINSNSLEGWRNYKATLKPALNILRQSKAYQNLRIE